MHRHIQTWTHGALDAIYDDAYAVHNVNRMVKSFVFLPDVALISMAKLSIGHNYGTNV
jgi:hypothetical protein